MGGTCSMKAQMRNAYRSWSENLNGRDHFVHLSINGRIILKQILKKYGRGWEPVTGSCQLSHVSSDSIKGSKFIYQL
jgi:hypothetical protein